MVKLCSPAAGSWDRLAILFPVVSLSRPFSQTRAVESITQVLRTERQNTNRSYNAVFLVLSLSLAANDAFLRPRLQFKMARPPPVMEVPFCRHLQSLK